MRDIESRLRRRLKAVDDTAQRLFSLSVEGLDLGPLVEQLEPSAGKQILEVVKVIGARVRGIRLVEAPRASAVRSLLSFVFTTLAHAAGTAQRAPYRGTATQVHGRGMTAVAGLCTHPEACAYR